MGQFRKGHSHCVRVQGSGALPSIARVSERTKVTHAQITHNLTLSLSEPFQKCTRLLEVKLDWGLHCKQAARRSLLNLRGRRKEGRGYNGSPVSPGQLVCISGQKMKGTEMRYGLTVRSRAFFRLARGLSRNTPAHVGQLRGEVTAISTAGPGTDSIPLIIKSALLIFRQTDVPTPLYPKLTPPVLPAERRRSPLFSQNTAYRLSSAHSLTLTIIPLRFILVGQAQYCGLRKHPIM